MKKINLTKKENRTRYLIAKYDVPPKGFDEFYSKEHYKDVESVISFINDPLIFPPNADFEYSSLAYSLINRIIEKVSCQIYLSYMRKILTEFDMCYTIVDLNNLLTFGRAK